MSKTQPIYPTIAHTVFLLLFTFTFLINTTDAQICQQPSTTTTKNDFSFCCCRTIEEKFINENHTDLHVFYTVSTWTVWKNITGRNETIFDQNKDHHCFTETSISSPIINITTECHCTNIYDDLSSHRTNIQFTCPKPKIVIGAFLDLNSTSGIEMKKSAELAIEEINKDPLYFPKYQVVLDTSGNSTNKDLHNFASHILLNHLEKKPPPVFFLGPENNLLAKTVASVSGLESKNILQFSVGTDDLYLSHERHVYPNFYRVNPSRYHYNRARVEIVKHYKWLNVALIYSSDAYHFQMNALLRQMLISNNINVVYEEAFHTDPTTTINSIKENGVKVILGSYSAVYASQVFCQIYCLEMFSPRYVWLMTDSFTPSATSVCSADKVACAMKNHFFLSTKELPDNGLPHIAVQNNQVSFDNTFKGLMAPLIYQPNNNTLAKYTYDAVWTMFDILKRAKPTLETLKVNLDRIFYGDTPARNLLSALVKTTDFNGITGRIRFDATGNRYNDVNISQSLTGNNLNGIGVFETEHSVLRLGSVHWLGWRPHRDMATIKTYRLLSYSVHWAMFILAWIGVAIALVFLIYVLVRRKREYVRNTYWQINLMVIFGSVFVYASLIFFVTEPESNIFGASGNDICLLRVVLFCLGLAFIIGALFSKLYLAYRVLRKNWFILIDKSRKRMFLWWFLVVLFTGLILLVWFLVSPFVMAEKVMEKREEIHCTMMTIDFDPFIEEYIYINICKGFSYPFAFAIVWFAALLVTATYLYYKTRHLFISNLSDVWHCGLCVLIIDLFIVAGLICAFLLADYPDLFGQVVGTLLWLCVTLVLIILFLHLLLNDDCGFCGRFKRLFKRLCCCVCCPTCCKKRCGDDNDTDEDYLSQQEDIYMYQQYHHRLPPNISSSNASSAGQASLNDINLDGGSLTKVDSAKNKKLAKKKKKKSGCCGNCGNKNGSGDDNDDDYDDGNSDSLLSRLFFGPKEARKGRHSNKNNNNGDESVGVGGKSRRHRIVRRRWKKKKRHIAVQTDSSGKKGEKYSDGIPQSTDIGDGLTVVDLDSADDTGAKKSWATSGKGPLKIYDKKPDWSHVKSHLKLQGVISTWKRPDQRQFASAGDIQALQKMQDTTSGSTEKSPSTLSPDSYLFAASSSTPGGNKTKTDASELSSSSLSVKNSGSPNGSPNASSRRNTGFNIPTYKHDYSHVKSSVNSGLSPGQVRRMSKRPGTDERRGSRNIQNRLLTNTNSQENKTPSQVRKNKVGPSVSAPASPVEVQVTPPSSGTPAIRIVNGPGSSPTPEQPNKQFLSKTTSGADGKQITTTIANSESSL
uniref:G-protein coupled receptors family 3 profile domain-containing protein n=2 Tax=Clytia hemisphaerica TaxID=252671 RepID=A0A7M5VET0_9CNID